MVQKNCVDNKILIICGPTASGKTSLAIECAKLLNSEVISADSMNIYRSLDIGTAKPTKTEMDSIPHHMIDIISPFEEFTVSDYKKTAEPILSDLISSGKIPVLCGGTGFYINSLLYDLSYGNSNANLLVRERYKKIALEKGNEYVYNILKEKDYDSAIKLHYNDVKRVIRALEISESGIKKSEIKDEFITKYNYKAFAIDVPREILYERINQRVDEMISSGLVDEVLNLKNIGITKDNQCTQGIGYKEIFDYLDGNISLTDAIELIKLNTRHYAKRQITFFKRLNGLKLLEYKSTKLLAKEILGEL